MVVAAAGPIFAGKVKTFNFMALVDISQSMWCEDYRQGNYQRSRLNIAKENLLSLTDELSDQSRLGLGVFAGNLESTLILVSPQELRGARGDLKSMIQSIQYYWTWKDGSSVKDALVQMAKILDSKKDAYGTGLTLIFLTDGEETFPNMYRELPLELEKFHNVHFYFAGVGTIEGAPVPEFEEGWRFKDFKKNSQGTPIVSKLEEKNLVELARNFNGSYLRIKSGSDLKTLAKNETLKIGERESSYELNRVFWGVSFILVALFLIL
jgi:Ca-activated chloride channel family protein